MKFCSRLYPKLTETRGFTFVEITLALGIASTLVGVVVLNLLNIHQTKTVQSTTEILISDLRSQQTKALSATTQGTLLPDDYGIFFGTTSYTLFKGTPYDPNNPSNAEVSLPAPFAFSNITFPNNQVVFSQGSGEVAGFIENQNTVTIHNPENQNTKTLEINRYGVVNSN